MSVKSHCHNHNSRHDRLQACAFQLNRTATVRIIIIAEMKQQPQQRLQQNEFKILHMFARLVASRNNYERKNTENLRVFCLEIFRCEESVRQQWWRRRQRFKPMTINLFRLIFFACVTQDHRCMYVPNKYAGCLWKIFFFFGTLALSISQSV